MYSVVYAWLERGYHMQLTLKQLNDLGLILPSERIELIENTPQQLTLEKNITFNEILNDCGYGKEEVYFMTSCMFRDEDGDIISGLRIWIDIRS